MFKNVEESFYLLNSSRSGSLLGSCHLALLLLDQLSKEFECNTQRQDDCRVDTQFNHGI